MKTYQIMPNSYGYPVWTEPRRLEENAQHIAKHLVENSLSHVTLWGTGTSGILIMTAISRAVDRYDQPGIVTPVISYVRKAGDEGHASGITNWPPTNPIIIVDDIVSSGRTLDRIIYALGKREKTGYVVGTCIYSYTPTERIKAQLPNLKFALL